MRSRRHIVLYPFCLKSGKLSDYNKPMGVATYKTFDDMPEELRKALPNMDDLKKLL